MDMLLSAICDSRGNKHFLESRDGNDTARCECGQQFETTDPSTVKAGDTVTLANQSPASATGVVEKITRLGTVKNPDRATHWQIDLRSYVGAFMVGPEAPYWTITDHEPPAPKWEPGTAGTATISTCETSGSTTRQHGMWWRRGDDEPIMFMTDFGSSWASHMVDSFVPDDVEPLKAQFERLRTVVEKAKQDARTIVGGGTGILIDGVQVIDKNLFTRIMQERAARTLPTRDQVAEVLRARLGGNLEAWHDDADNILAVFEQGSAALEVLEYEPGTVYEITTHDGDTMRAWCHSGALNPDAWTAEECVTFVNQDGAEFLPGELKTATPRASVAETLRADLDAARAQVSDLTGRNAALEALAQEQKQGIQVRDTWIEDHTDDA